MTDDADTLCNAVVSTAVAWTAVAVAVLPLIVSAVARGRERGDRGSAMRL